MIAEERETTVVVSDADETVRIWTAQRKVITRLRKEPLFTEVRTGSHDGTEWAEFTIPSELWSPMGVVRKRKMTPELAQRARENLAKARR